MTEPGPSPDEGGGHDQSSDPDGQHPGRHASPTPEDSSVIDLRTGLSAVRSTQIEPASGTSTSAASDAPASTLPASPSGPPPHAGVPPLPPQPLPPQPLPIQSAPLLRPVPVPPLDEVVEVSAGDAAATEPHRPGPGAPAGSAGSPAPAARRAPAAAVSDQNGRRVARRDGGPGRPDRSPPVSIEASRSVVRAFLPLVAVLVVTACVIGLVSFRSAGAARSAAALARSVDRERTVQLATDELWSGVLALVAGGVGEEVVTPDEVMTLVGASRSDPPGPVPAGARVGDALQDARASHTRFVDAVGDALDEHGDEPVELGNGLSDLTQLHHRAADDAEALAAALDARAADELSTSDGLQAAALVLGLLGLLAAVVAGLVARRRVRELVDLPASAIATTMGRFASGEVEARSRPADEAGLGALAAAVDVDLDRVSGEVERLHRRAEWGEQRRMIFEALDEAESEDAAHEVIRRALSMIDDAHHPVELLLTERGSTRLRSVASDPTVTSPGCPVDHTGACVALRRGQVAVFDSSESINACPKLRDRPGGPCAAVCVPVTVATRPVGVLHMTGPELEPPGAPVADRLVTLSVQLGNRLGALRTLESTRKEASTDGLTGLPNRRMLESEVATLLERGTPFVMVLADLDKFKKLNDNFGHEIGDKALQLFAGVLRDNVRGNDVVSRLGGEEFVLVYPNMSVEISIEAIGRLRQALARAIAASRLPSFTCSFGVSHSEVGGDGDTILRVADAGLLRAKELGGDQAVFADEDLAATVFSNGDGPIGRSEESREPSTGSAAPSEGSDAADGGDPTEARGADDEGHEAPPDV